MELEFHRLDFRYESLRRRSPEIEKRLMASLAENGQQMPIVVVRGEKDQSIIVDGYKRVRALKALKMDTVQAIYWDLDQAEALMLERVIRSAESDNPLEQARLLRELHLRFALSYEEMAQRFDKSKSWVSRRLSLIQDLPEEIQTRVIEGQIIAHGAMKYLVPLARANKEEGLQLAAKITGHRLSSRQIGLLYKAWISGDKKIRELILQDPCLYLRAIEEVSREKRIEEKTAAQQFMADYGAMGGICRRICSKLRQGLAQQVLCVEREEIHRCMRQAQNDSEQLFDLSVKEFGDAR